MAFQVIAVTNRRLCPPSGSPAGAFLAQVERIAAAGPDALMLREKDLSEGAYLALAAEVRGICAGYGVEFVAHRYPAAASPGGAVHLPWDVFCAGGAPPGANFGVSVHSLEDARQAAEGGAARLLLGNIFETACKPGLPGRGLALLARLCRETPLPVYAIGGITPANAPSIRAAGAAGLCLMSSLMASPAPSALIGGVRG